MRLKRPFEYNIKPNEVDKGNHWLTVDLKNVSTDVMTQLDIQLHSLDSYFINVYGSGSYVSNLEQNETRSIPFQIAAHGSSNIYVTITGYRDGVYFYWETPMEKIRVRAEVAEIKNLFVLTHPYTSIGKTIEVEAIIKAITGGKTLELSFWVDTRTGTFEKIADIKTKILEKDEEVRYSTEFIPKETGIHEIYAYLYDGTTLLGRKNNTIYAQS
ncbi:hypothetical protein JW865_03755 [Candidatus Bathyarchaeota archaeon]|nr:hypothetical protein [Candidatus Bathyarchaeota archaeon]